jgi:Ca2+-binding EF-hand superfamily protein
LQSEEFWKTAEERYRALDVDESGTIEAEELFPVIMELTDSEAWAITEEHCKKV